MISEQSLAQLTNQLQVPVIISGVMAKTEELSDTTELALHELLSNMSPKDALIAIALSSQTIIQNVQNPSKGMLILQRESIRIINDYAASYYAANGNEDFSVHEIAEDLEGLGVLLKLAAPVFQTQDILARALFKILRIQADTHHMTVEMVAEMMDEAAQNKNTTAPLSQPQQSPAHCAHSFNNVVAFPM